MHNPLGLDASLCSYSTGARITSLNANSPFSVSPKANCPTRKGGAIWRFQGISLLEDHLNPAGKLLRIPPEYTSCRTDRGTRGSLLPAPFFNAEVALDRPGDFVVELHDIVGTGLYAAATTRDTPPRLLDGHFFRKPFLDLVKVIDTLLRFQTRH